MRTRNSIYAWLLLSVFLPMMILSSIHVHDDMAVGVSCSDCINHTPHQSHISLDGTHMHDCLLCQFASLPFVVAAITTLAIVPRGQFTTIVELSVKLQFTTCRINSPRAPPHCI